MHVKASELKPGDKVQLFEGPYGTATVVQVEDESCRRYDQYANRSLEVVLWRPYMQTSDVLYSGGNVIPGIGLEIVRIPQCNTLYNRLEKGPELR